MTRYPFVASPFRVNIAGLRRQGPFSAREHRQGRIEGLSVSASAVPAAAVVDVDVVLEPAHRGVMVSGTVSTAWEGECRRCLGPASGELRIPVRELFEQDADTEETGTYSFSGERLDLEQLAREAVMLELPLAPLCRHGCRGLCPSCGTNLNEARCACETGEASGL
ncbi:MAG: YceD family protein [Acidimicrobiales bacterium]